MTLTLILGGVRAGKSARALALADANAPNGRVLFVAAAQAFDDEMKHRIDAHKRERPVTWTTLESPMTLSRDIADQFQRARESYEVVLIDCLTLWTSNILLSIGEDEDAEQSVAGHVAELLRLTESSAPASDAHWIIVSNEVGLGVVPPTPLGRRYRDALGRANQLVAAAASDVVLMVAGLELPLKSR
ncbi:MAG TPA: bifunctional adenosylcobinamide kinase/adenosylcobinamide-phosphate guanylyltransferase [Gemmatimonadaceae bacterium]|jgi:adenosylcobinamide kinase/adenosylcobinamide-phosphate guanylyltransferase